MKKLLLTLTFALSALAFGQTVSNLSFNSDILNWSATNSTIAYDNTLDATGNGGGSLKITTSAAGGRAQTNPGAFPINGAASYAFSCKVYGAAGTKIQLLPFQSGAGLTAASYTIVNSNTWETIPPTVYAIPNPSSNVILRVVGVDSGVTFNVDDVQWVLQAPADAAYLNVTASGPGTVAKSPNTAFYAGGDNVTVTGTPKSHCIFDGWSGDFTSTTNPDTVPMVASTTKNVTGNFIVDPTFNYAFLFNTNGDLEAWSNTTDSNLSVSQAGGIVTLTPTANQFARFSLTGFPIPAASFNKLTVKLQNNSATTDQLAININNGTSTNTVINTISTSDASFVTYSFYLNPAVYTAWTGTISDLRLRFSNAAAATGKPIDASTILIDEIILSYDASLATGDVSKAKNLLQVYVSENTLNFRNANVSKATIFNMNGQLVKDAKVQNNAVDVSNLKAGVYMVKTVAQDNTETVTKFIKK